MGCIYLETCFVIQRLMFDVIPHYPLTVSGKSLNINTWTGEVSLTFQTRLTETKQRVKKTVSHTSGGGCLRNILPSVPRTYT